ncbi:MAG: bifunctional [glutamate--ammonia ligase]-adenylyl-L-tyrosine phosphorylase/[glutamate--ammonia-ligase] adenylyltransferase [Erythrobacter sp.]
MANFQALDWDDALSRAEAESRFLARGLERDPELAGLLAQGDAEGALDWALHIGAAETDVSVSLRRERNALLTVLGVADLAGAFPLSRIVSELSNCADRALDRAISHVITQRVEGAEPAGMIALALGKHGARELNYSSDIDPILLYDPETLPRRAADEPGEAAQRYARGIVKLLSESTAHGIVFRVDLRLRPASEVSPLAVSIETARSHYESSALAWERAAFIRARAAAGDIAAGEQFLEHLRPFVWRSSLDFGAIEEIRQLTAQIRLNYDGPTQPGPGFDVKRGRGGIREIEFYAQTHQLIHGGRDQSLRVQGTRATLDALADAGRIEAAGAEMLGQHYDRLRAIEHRLQMIDDRQTHTLPSGEALDAVARLDGLSSGTALVSELNDITGEVAAAYDTLIGEEVEQAPSAGPQAAPQSPALQEQLANLGIAKPDQLAGRIEDWCDGRFQCLRTPQAVAAFDALLPDLITAIADTDDPTRAIARWETLLEKTSSAINLFHLLKARPALLTRLLGVLTLSPMLAGELARRPELLDTLIDESALQLPGSVEEIAAAIEAGAEREDYEAKLDSIRVATGEARFALGVQLIEAHSDPLDIGSGLSRAAEAALQVAVSAATGEFEKAHGRIAGSELVILGLGRLGGGALTHASDLDMIYLFNGDFAAESDGPRPLGATLYFNRLATRVSAALSVPTAEGALYEVDTRLRPQGNQGPLAVSLEAFAKYQREAAWTWEHMALARARVLVGSDAVRTELGDMISAVLHKQRDGGKLKEQVLSMRHEMAQHKSARGPLDVKLMRGGLVDFEFMIHFLQLRDAMALEPDFAAALPLLAEAGKIPHELIAAYDLMTRLLVAGRLLAPGGQQPPKAAGAVLARACRAQDYPELLRLLGAARHGVAKAWESILGQSLEIDE